MTQTNYDRFMCNHAAVYVGTYGKYNSGNLGGDWLFLEDYTDQQDFIDACYDLHRDEEDPELMFQDYSGFPKDFYFESEILAEYWDWLTLPDSDRDLIELFCELSGEGIVEVMKQGGIDHINFIGSGPSFGCVVSDYADDAMDLSGIPSSLIYCIDWVAWGEEQGFHHTYKGGSCYVFCF